MIDAKLIDKVLFIAACLIFPVVWGVVVNWLFNHWQGQMAAKTEENPVYPDYQI